MKYEVKFTSQFKRDLKLARKQGKDIRLAIPECPRYSFGVIPYFFLKPCFHLYSFTIYDIL